MTGLIGSVTLNNDGDMLTIGNNGAFTFDTLVPFNSPYDVSVVTQPAGQTCTVSNGNGTMGAADTIDVNVNCVANGYALGGTVNGLIGSVTLDNGGDTLSINSDGAFIFGASVLFQSSYSVTVTIQPEGQTCAVVDGNGTMGAGDVTDVTVNCVANGYTLGGAVNGLIGSVTLDNGGDTLSINSDGAFTFGSTVLFQNTYNVTVSIQLATHTCFVNNGTGTMGAGNISNLIVDCITNQTVLNCAEALSNNSASPDGVYNVEPDGAGGESAFDMYCDMTTDGGGWAKILQYPLAPFTDSANAIGTIAIASNTAVAKLSDTQINALLASRSLEEADYRMDGDKHPQDHKLYVRSQGQFIDAASSWNVFDPTMNFLAACLTADFAGCTYTPNGGQFLTLIHYRLEQRVLVCRRLLTMRHDSVWISMVRPSASAMGATLTGVYPQVASENHR